MTWKEFKNAVEAQGVKDSHTILYIDVGDMHSDAFRVEYRSDSPGHKDDVEIWT